MSKLSSSFATTLAAIVWNVFFGVNWAHKPHFANRIKNFIYNRGMMFPKISKFWIVLLNIVYILSQCLSACVWWAVQRRSLWRIRSIDNVHVAEIRTELILKAKRTFEYDAIMISFLFGENWNNIAIFWFIFTNFIFILILFF